jgi:hypothetical protein
MKKALLLAAAVLLALGCAATKKGQAELAHQGQGQLAAPLQLAAVDGATVQDAALIVPKIESKRPDRHQMDVRAYWEQRKAEVNKANTEGAGKIDMSAKRNREAREMIEKKKQSAVMGGVDEPGMTNIMSDKMKREAQQMVKGMRQAVMNSLDEPHGNDTRRVDLEMSDVNMSRANGAGLVGMQPHDHYLSQGECPQGRCVNRELGSSGRMNSLGNLLDP